MPSIFKPQTLKVLISLGDTVDNLVSMAEKIFIGRGMGVIKKAWVRKVLIVALTELKDYDIPQLTPEIEAVLDYQIERAVKWLKQYEPPVGITVSGPYTEAGS